MASTTYLTVDDFERLPHEISESHELVDGTLVPVSGNTPNSNRIRDLLVVLLTPVVREQNLGLVIAEQEYDFGGNVHGPDVTFLTAAKKALLNGRKRVQRFAPDLAIEVVSEYDSYSSLKRKKERYLRCGTREVWIVSPEDCEIEVYTEGNVRVLRGEDELSTSLIPDFRITVRQLFELAWK
jgi:Uma2 family endonuclease